MVSVRSGPACTTVRHSSTKASVRVGESRKTVWGRIDYTLAEAPPEVGASVSRPSLETTRRNLSALVNEPAG